MYEKREIVLTKDEAELIYFQLRARKDFFKKQVESIDSKKLDYRISRDGLRNSYIKTIEDLNSVMAKLLE